MGEKNPRERGLLLPPCKAIDIYLAAIISLLETYFLAVVFFSASQRFR